MRAVFSVIHTKKLLRYGVIFSISIFIILMFFAPLLCRLYSRITFFRRYGIQSIAIGTADTQEKNMYIHTGNQLIFFLDPALHTSLDAEVCMQLPNRGMLYPAVLSHNQAVIDTNTARRYGLRAGDTVYVKVSYTAEVQQYTITALIHDCYSPLGTFDQTGMIFTGYDSAFTDSLAVRYILFASKPLRDLESTIIQTSYQLIAVSQSKNTLYALIILSISIYAVIFLLLSQLLKNSAAIKTPEQIVFMYRLGLPSRSCAVLVFFVSCCFFGFPFCAAAGLYRLCFPHTMTGYVFCTFGTVTLTIMIIWNIRVFFKAGMIRTFLRAVQNCKT